MNINEYWNRPQPHGVPGSADNRGEGHKKVMFQHPGSGGQEEPSLDTQLADMTVAQFVATRFLPDHIAIKTSPGKRHYQAILKHILTPEEVETIFGAPSEGSRSKMQPKPEWPYISDVKLNEARPEHVQRLIAAAVNGGYSSQTIRHIRNVVGAVFSHALRTRHFLGDNPASLVVLPGMKRRESHSLTLDQTIKVLELMQYPEREVTLFAILTSMNIAEICGLQWKFVNLTEHHLSREGQSIPPRSIVVRNQWYRGELCTVPAGRRKSIPIPQLLFSVLHTLSRTKSSGWNDFVLSTKSGRPINQINLAARRLKQIGRDLEMPWISWQVLRRTRGVLAYEFGTQIQHELAKALPPMSTATSPIAVLGKIVDRKRN
jgi:integrase